MDPRVALLRGFSRRFVPGTAKVETDRFGFAFLEELLADGATLEYGELTAHRLLHKYKLANLSEARMDALLGLHLAKECNVCRYFDAEANDAFCFNLDNNHKTDNTRAIPEMDLAVGALEDRLRGLGCAPLVVASGRGYHVWCRLEGPVANDRLHRFMMRAAVSALMAFHAAGRDHRKVKFNFYPDTRTHGVVSLRLFGSDHAKNKVFSRVLAPGGLLDERDSWRRFEDFLGSGTIPEATFDAALASLAAV